jgi:hypothetical protein
MGSRTLFRIFLRMGITLDYSTNNPKIDRILQGTIYPNDEEIIDMLKELQRSHYETLKNLAFEVEKISKNI